MSEQLSALSHLSGKLFCHLLWREAQDVLPLTALLKDVLVGEVVCGVTVRRVRVCKGE